MRPAATSGDKPGWYTSLGKGFLHGVEEVGYGAAQLGAHVFAGKETQESLRKSAAKMESEWARDPAHTAHPLWAFGGEVAGNLLATAPVMLLPGGVVARAAMQGAAMGLAEPVTSNNYWGEKAWQVAAGTAASVTGERLISTVGRAAAPMVDRATRELTARGVKLTPGAMFNFRSPEEFAGFFPMLGRFIRAGESRSIESYNIATLNQALEPLHVTVPSHIRAGHDANRWAAQQFNDAYNTWKKAVNFQVTPRFANNINNLWQMSRSMPEYAAFNHDMRDVLIKNIRGAGMGGMDGATFKDVESELSTRAYQYLNSPLPTQRHVGQALRQVHQELVEELRHQNPFARDQLDRIDAGMAMMMRIQDAAQMNVKGMGVFGSHELLQAVRNFDKTVRNNAFANGDALLQKWAEYGIDKVPESVRQMHRLRTPLFLGETAGLTTIAHLAGMPASLPATALGGALTLPYTRAGGAALRRLAQPPGPARQAIRRAATQGDISRYLDPAFGHLGARVTQ